MKFDTLNEMIPYVTGGKPKVLTMSPYNAITLAMPGRHAKDTDPVGGDFVVMVDDEGMDWTRHQFTHTDLFVDLQLKKERNQNATNLLLHDYYSIITGGSPTTSAWMDNVITASGAPFKGAGIHPQTFLYAVQCLAVAEHRRYAKYENKFGGRFLPFRFASGIVEGLWDTTAATGMQRRGRPGVEILEKANGTPTLTRKLMDA